MNFPRVLVINWDPFWQGSATGLTMSRLFKGWPRERLACLYTSEFIPDQSFCERYWRLTIRDLRLVRCFMRNDTHNVAVTRELRMRNAVPASGRVSSKNWVDKMGRRLRMSLARQSVRELDVFQIPEDILREIEDFSPQLIYSALGSNAVMQLVIEMADHFGIPVVPHFLDDWLPTLYHASVFRVVLRRTMFHRVEKVLTRSSKRLVIGEAMATEYASRYGGDFIPFMNAVEPEMLSEMVPPPPPCQSLHLVYVGGLHLNRWHSLREIGRALNVLRAEGVQAEVLIYTPPTYAEMGKKLDMPPVMHFLGSLAPAQVPGVLRDADILLHIESFDHIGRTYARYSISTKIPEYMAASRPILAYGPEELASIHYVRDSGAGLVVGKQNRDDLLAALRKLLTSESLRETLGRTGHEVAVSRHNAALQRDHFYSVLKLAEG